MKKKNIILFTCLIAVGIVTSCNKFLDVQPEDKVLESELYSTKEGVRTVLNGFYLDLANSNLYGDKLTLSTVEILGQRYNLSSSSHNEFKTATYAYKEKPTITHLDDIWSKSFSTILNINAFVENLEKYKGVIDQKTEDIYKGEALAMRAFLHFDLFRLYGPRYSTADSTKQSLPYYQGSKTTINPLLPGNEFIDNVIADLNEAETLLQQDAIIALGPNIAKPEAMVDFLINNRNYRINYYAVKALKARVLLYRGDKVSALKYAKEIIAVSEKFPWTTSGNALVEKQNPDRAFTTEMLFGIMNSQLYDRYQKLFDPSNQDKQILAPIEARLSALYENNENDYRYNLNWAKPSNGSKPYKTFLKYADIVDKEKSFRYTIPLIKKSEMFLIAAESEPVAAEGVAHLNELRANRGLLPLAATANINTELQKEYQKDFFGEGQLFFFYKRRNVTSIPNGSALSGNISVNYNIPMPDSEAIYRP
ncbi:RagB/SusD family nutrient uptake outer membrane protein [Sphingobacterium faecale]|uniref:RagB/SusD family nutrient uptake outer membrane protein n=1 Tax=Sphingobacterium faecale TaxID=2803775 RepID=A0ABS1R6G1_9SPHI|nr:RagB/SusD family nutrient uptake outer membrane protein [Sphingobacterium faecale]MBL1409451.1 RagB/SusD family nutrient uptake outer membrane protein [Sphingobacterium faecale]